MMAFRLLAGAMTPSLGMAVFPVRKLFGVKIGVCDVQEMLPFRAAPGATGDRLSPVGIAGAGQFLM